MGENSKIEWTGETWNPIAGCSIKSPGCTNCYAMRMAARIEKMNPGLEHYRGLTKPSKGGPVWTGKVALAPIETIRKPLGWKKPRSIFVNSMSDLFHDDVPDEWIADIFSVMAETPQHQYQVLTKRPDRMMRILRGPKPHYLWNPKLRHGRKLPNVWLGTSVERQPEADERRAAMWELGTSGWNTWVSYEPAIGPVDWTGWEFIRWLVSGGESGPNARPSHPDWHRAARGWSASHDIPYFFKQHGSWVADKAPNVPWGTLDIEGGFFPSTTPWNGRQGADSETGEVVVYRVGKARAGHLLDGKAWRQFPEVRHG